MSDLALTFDGDRMICDLEFDGVDLRMAASDRTALLVSLGSDARARPDDPLPHTPAAAALAPDELPLHRRGWVGDGLDAAGERIGCRLWLLWREKATEQVRRRAVAYAREGLAWAIAEGRTVEIDSGWHGTRLLLRVRLGAARLDLPVTGV